ncbi:MAG: hypothetical protein R3240_10910 [Gammaproteobacteria bacterium]|nr:hypothetical protein [Gammaproteobacteria bacterium]
MTNLIEQFRSLTKQEKAYLVKYPHHLLKLKNCKDKAIAETERIFGISGDNDESDAFRHCFWAAMLSRELGYEHALEITSAHESSPSSDPEEKAMDLFNNSIGLNIGQDMSNDDLLSQRCILNLLDGNLKVINPKNK